MKHLPFFGPTRFWGKMPFWEVPGDEWDTYLAERERSNWRFVVGFFSVMFGLIVLMRACVVWLQ